MEQEASTTAEFIAVSVTGLAQMARDSDLNSLALILDMAVLEASACITGPGTKSLADESI